MFFLKTFLVSINEERSANKTDETLSYFAITASRIITANFGQAYTILAQIRVCTV